MHRSHACKCSCILDNKRLVSRDGSSTLGDAMALPNRLTEKQRRNARRQTRAKRRARRKLARANACIGKIKHADKYGAIAHLKRLNIANLSPYPCPHCKGWHVGHARQKIQLRIDQVLGLLNSV